MNQSIKKILGTANKLVLWPVICLALGGCASLNTATELAATDTPTLPVTENACQVTDAVWLKPPEDSAVQDAPAYGYYYVNEDSSILASAWWVKGEYEHYLRAGSEGVKVGWFRPAGADLQITGERLDASSPPLDAHVPCCYPTRFQATGLIFPEAGCWRVTATAEDKVLSFILLVNP
jgi:hypothetical protein